MEIMNFTVSQTGDTQVFALKGRLDSDSAAEFERLSLQEIKSDTKVLILECTDLEYLSSAGLRIILGIGKRLQAKGAKLVLSVPKGMTRQIIEAAGFHKLFTVCSNLQEAG